MQLYRQLRRDITDGLYKYSQKLPSKRLLATETNTSVITVEHAYAILCDEGYVLSKERSGYFVIYRKYDLMPTQETDEPSTATLPPVHHSGEEFPFSVYAKTVRNVLSAHGDRIFTRSPNAGIPELRQAICNYLARGKGIYVEAEQIVIGSGAEYLYGLIVQFLGHERIYAVEDPSYEKICAVYQANGARCDFLKMGKNGILTSELQKTKATVLHVTPFRSFPSGITATASKRSEYVNWAQTRGGIIIEDDFDSEFSVSTKHEDTVFSLEPLNSIIYVNTFTKTISPSMRIGYMVLPQKQVKPFFEKVGFFSCTVPVLEQYVLCDILLSGAFERHINRIRRKRRQKES